MEFILAGINHVSPLAQFIVLGFGGCYLIATLLSVVTKTK